MAVLKNIDTTSYTDTDVDPDNLYKTYKYRILIYDVNGNESQNPPEITANFDTPGPIGFMRWYLTTEDGKINRNNSSNYSINAYFYSINPINTIKYNYSQMVKSGLTLLLLFQAIQELISTRRRLQEITISE